MDDTLLYSPINFLVFVISVTGILTDYTSGKMIFPLYLKWLAKGLLSIIGSFFLWSNFSLLSSGLCIHKISHLSSYGLSSSVVFNCFQCLSLILLLLELVMKMLLSMFFMLLLSFFALNCSLLLPCTLCILTFFPLQY